jgi:hypothetical protein
MGAEYRGANAGNRKRKAAHLEEVHHHNCVDDELLPIRVTTASCAASSEIPVKLIKQQLNHGLNQNSSQVEPASGISCCQLPMVTWKSHV